MQIKSHAGCWNPASRRLPLSLKYLGRTFWTMGGSTEIGFVTGFTRIRRTFVDRILVVDCRPDQQYQRVRQRDRLDGTSIGRIMRVQASREEKLAAANDIIANTGRIEQLQEQVEKLHQAYLVLAQEYSVFNITRY
jgi:hypothetical protein